MARTMGGRRAAAPWQAGVVVAMVRRVALGAAVLGGVAACGSARAPATGAGTPRGSLYELGLQELAMAGDASDVFVAIERLRPAFFRPRASAVALRGARPQLSVFINGSYSGPVDVLRTLPVSHVSRVRFVQPAQAMTTVGSQRVGDGVIMVTLKHAVARR